MTWTLTTSGAAIIKAGKNASSTIVASGAALLQFCTQVEGRIVAETRRDWVDSYSSVDAGTQNLLGDVASDLIAMKMINYDMSGFISRTEAQTMLDVLRDNASQGLRILKDFKSNTIKPI